MNDSVSYVAMPLDSRCRWWSVYIPSKFKITNPDDKQSIRALGFLRTGADIELNEGDAVIDSEANHHTKLRGFRVKIGIVFNGKLVWYQPGASTKAKIKAWANSDRWTILRRGSGDVAACLRLFIAWQMGFRFDLTSMTANTENPGKHYCKGEVNHELYK